jgi:CrcB protein
VAVTRVARQPALRRGQRRVSAGQLLAIAGGGFLGGLARYAVTQAFPIGDRGFPWPVLAINTAGAFALAAFLVLLTEVVPPTRYARPAIGTGFLGAFTTFSSVVGSVDQLAAHGRLALAVAYLAASVGLGIAAAMSGLIAARAAVRSRRSERR